MQQLDLLIEQYLKYDSDYAVLLTGDWGTGKTYYFNHTIIPLINNTKPYKAITISLFGLNSIGEIQTQILLSSINLSGTKNKTATTILGTLSKGFLNKFTGFDVDAIDSSAWAELINEIKGFENLVICFDDIERRNNELSISQFIGFVNTLIEKHKAKIILIANEDKIVDFEESKEKVIGNTIHYLPDYNSIFDSIVQVNFDSSEEYISFLQNKKSLILSIFENTSKNLRTLKYALSRFKEIYSKVEELIKNEIYLVSKKDEILTDALHFSYAISDEYRSGEISFKEKKGLDTFDAFSMMMAISFPEYQGYGNQ